MPFLTCRSYSYSPCPDEKHDKLINFSLLISFLVTAGSKLFLSHLCGGKGRGEEGMGRWDLLRLLRSQLDLWGEVFFATFCFVLLLVWLVGWLVLCSFLFVCLFACLFVFHLVVEVIAIHPHGWCMLGVFFCC